MSLSDEIRNIGKRCESKGTCGFPHEMGITCADFPSCGICISGALGKLADKVYLIEHERSEDRETDELVREKEYLMDRYDESLSAASYRAERDAALQDVERMRPAYEWVRERGGLEEVKRAMQDSDNRRVELCSALGIDTVTGWSDALVEMDKRLMPPGYKWPLFDDNKPIMFGEKAQLDNAVGEIQTFELHRNGYFTIVTVDDDGNVARKRYANNERVKRPKPDPIGADGLPIKKGETVYATVEGGPYKVIDVSDNGSVIVDAFPDMGMHCSMFAHTKPEPPDSWERLEEDSNESPFEYCYKVGHGLDAFEDAEEYKSADLVRRAKALAKKENKK